jgi:hypothetical protein
VAKVDVSQFVKQRHDLHRLGVIAVHADFEALELLLIAVVTELPRGPAE